MATIFSSDKNYSQRSAREKLEIILANQDHLQKIKNGSALILAARSMSIQKERLSPKQLSYIDGILEKVYKGANYKSCSLKIDNKRKNLRY